MSEQHKITHTFVICAYGESPYLEECIQSLISQNIRSNILVSTSTPNKYIQGLSQKYGLQYFVNQGEKGIAGDWNFALQLPDTVLVTLAHQDDVYMPDYTKKITEAYCQSRNPIILFTDYYELRNGKTVKSNQVLSVKRMLLFPLRYKRLWSSRFVRRRILSIGSAICCPTVAMVRNRMPCPLFKNNMKSNIDWQAWEELTRENGAFVYISEPLVKHRIHEDSTTSELLAQSARIDEDIYMYQKFWPKPIARFIEFFYSKNEKSNKLK